MCLYPRVMKNPKYKATKKNGGIIPPVSDERIKYVPIACTQCMECRKAKAREWQVRLLEDVKTHTNGKFIALTFSNESIKEIYNSPATKNWPGLKNISGYELDNQIATRGMRLFLERWRKKFKKSLRHWAVTELGHTGTENIHIHAIVWTDETMDTIRNIWQYGWMWPRPQSKEKNWVNAQTVNYMVKYVNKKDEDHPSYNSIILTSAGIGGNYINRYDSKKNKYQGEQTKETYRTNTGHEINMPIYWRNKIYSEEEREKLWIQKLDKQERWVMGEKIDIRNGDKDYYRTLEHYRKINIQLGYGTGEKDWQKEKYEEERRVILQSKRLEQKKKTFSNEKTIKLELKENETYIEIGKWREDFTLPHNPDANAPG